MTFDDGFQAHYTHVRKIFNQFGFKGTFYVNPHRLKKTRTDSDEQTHAYWSQLSEMAREGHEIGSHSYSHPYLTGMEIGDETTPGTLLHELSASKKTIEEMIPGYRCITMAHPFGAYDSTVIEHALKYYHASRSAGVLINESSLTNEEFMKLNGKAIRWRDKRETPEDDAPKLKRFITSLEKECIPHGKWAILIAHEVLPFSELKDTDSYEPTSNEWLISLCEYLEDESQNGNLWVDTVANVTKYIKERDAFTHEILSLSKDEIEIKLDTFLDHEIFNYPLTVEIILPDTWKSVILTQNGRNELLAAQPGKEQACIIAKIVPDGSVVKIKRND